MLHGPGALRLSGDQRKRAQRVASDVSSRLASVRKILGRAQHHNTRDSLAVEMLEVPCVAGQKIVGLPMNRGRQDWLVLRIEPDALWQSESLRGDDGGDGRAV